MPSPHPPSPRLTLRTALVRVARVGLAFLLTAWIIGRSMPWPQDAGMALRMEHVASDPEGYDLLIVGPSGFYRGLDPRTIERVLARRGHDLRCFNLSAPGMVSWEADHTLRAAIEHAGPRLKWVVIEPSPWDPDTSTQNVDSYRFYHWHTPAQAADLARASLALDLPRRERLALAWVHLQKALERFCGYGAGVEFAKARLGLEPPAPALVASVEAGGYLPLERDPDPAVAKRHHTFVTKKRADFVREIARLRGVVQRPFRANPAILEDYDLAAHRRQVRYLEERGLEVLHVVAPYAARDQRWPMLEHLGEIETLLAFDDPVRFPTFYEVANRFDRQHLTEEAARAFSAAFARALADELDARASAD